VFHQSPQRPLAFVFQIREQMLVFDPGGDEFGARTLHFREQPLTGLVDKGDITEVYNGAGAWRELSRILPARTQLVNPRSREMSAETPALSAGRLRVRNPKHQHYLSMVPGEGIWAAKSPTAIFEGVSSGGGKCDDGDPARYRDFGT
jgi:hypothetical protein